MFAASSNSCHYYPLLLLKHKFQTLIKHCILSFLFAWNCSPSISLTIPVSIVLTKLNTITQRVAFEEYALTSLFFLILYLWFTFFSVLLCMCVCVSVVAFISVRYDLKRVTLSHSPSRWLSYATINKLNLCWMLCESSVENAFSALQIQTNCIR